MIELTKKLQKEIKNDNKGVQAELSKYSKRNAKRFRENGN